MSDTKDTKAIIQFIGLCLFTNSRTPNGGVTVLLPNCTPPRNVTGNKEIGVHIEEHSSVLLFRREDLVQPTDWEVDEYHPDPSYQAACPCDHIVTFQAPRRTRAGMLEQTNLKLPSLKRCCTRMRKQFPLQKDALAVVKITEGTLNSCVVLATENEPVDRTDTWLSLPTEDTFTIYAYPRKGGRPKTLVLQPNANVFVSNLPSYMVQHDDDHEHEHTVSTTLTAEGAHYEAYYNLLRHDPDCTHNRGFQDRPILPPCPLPAPRFIYNKPTFIEAVSSECSNSTWP